MYKILLLVTLGCLVLTQALNNIALGERELGDAALVTLFASTGPHDLARNLTLIFDYESINGEEITYVKVLFSPVS